MTNQRTLWDDGVGMPAAHSLVRAGVARPVKPPRDTSHLAPDAALPPASRMLGSGAATKNAPTYDPAVASHLAQPHSRLGAQLRHLHKALGEHPAAEGLQAAIEGVLRGRNVREHLATIHTTLGLAAAAGIKNRWLRAHVDNMLGGYNWHTMAHNLTADARLHAHLENGGSPAYLRHLYRRRGMKASEVDAALAAGVARYHDAVNDRTFLSEVHPGADAPTKKEARAYLRYVVDTEGDPTHHARLARTFRLVHKESLPLLTAFSRGGGAKLGPLAALVDKFHESHGMYWPWIGHTITHPDVKYTKIKGGRGTPAKQGRVRYDVAPFFGGKPYHEVQFSTSGSTHLFHAPVESVAEFHEAREAAEHPVEGHVFGDHVFDLSHLPETPTRLSRMGAAEVAEGYHEKLPHFALHDLLLENDWHHDQRTLDLLNGDAPVPEGHSVKAKVVPAGDGSHKVVAWHDEAPFHVRHGADLLRLRGDDAVYGHPFDHVTHGPGGLFAVMDAAGGRGSVYDMHPAHGFMRPGLSPRDFDTYEAAVAHTEERARGTTTH